MVAAVILRHGAKVDTEELVLWASVRLAQYKAPKQVIIVDDLPRTGTRKVQRDKLKPFFDSALAGKEDS